MKADLRSSILWLGPKQLLELRQARGRVITSVIGQVWLTQEDDLRDIVIGAGESYRIERDGVALAQSVHGAAYVLVEDGVAGRVIGPDGTSDPLAAPAADPATAGIGALPEAWTSMNLHAWARHERSRLLGAALAAVFNGVADRVLALGRRRPNLLPSAATNPSR